MESILIHTNSREELNLLQELAKKMGFESEIINSEKEDDALARAINENNKSESLNFEEAKEFYHSLKKQK